MLNLILASAAAAALLGAPGAPRVERVLLRTDHPLACASGYHADPAGNCQPLNDIPDRYCPKGLVMKPMFDTWRCEPPPPGYSY